MLSFVLSFLVFLFFFLFWSNLKWSGFIFMFWDIYKYIVPVYCHRKLINEILSEGEGEGRWLQGSPHMDLSQFWELLETLLIPSDYRRNRASHVSTVWPQVTLSIQINLRFKFSFLVTHLAPQPMLKSHSSQRHFPRHTGKQRRACCPRLLVQLCFPLLLIEHCEKTVQNGSQKWFKTWTIFFSK